MGRQVQQLLHMHLQGERPQLGPSYTSTRNGFRLALVLAGLRSQPCLGGSYLTQGHYDDLMIMFSWPAFQAPNSPTLEMAKLRVKVSVA